MSTETLSPQPIDQETAHQHDVVQGEVVAHEDQPFNGLFEGEEVSATPPSKKERRKKREVVESIDSENVHFHGDVNWAQVEEMRELILTSEGEDRQKNAEFAAEAMILEDENSEAYKRHRAELVKILLSSPEKFAKEAGRYEQYQARRDGVKVKRTKPAKDETGSVDLGGDQDSERTSEPTARSLRRSVKQMDRQHGGLVGEIADTGTKPAYLESQRQKFVEIMQSHGYEVNDKNRNSAERETLRKMVSQFAELKTSSDEERKAYEDQLVDMFHDYVKLSDEDREDFNEVLADRHETAAKLAAIENEHTEARESHERVSTRVRRSLGVAAAGLITGARGRWNARKERIANSEEQPALFDDKPYRKRRVNREAFANGGNRLRNMPHTAYHNLMARMADRKLRNEERLAAMTEEERAAEKKKNNRHKVAGALVGVAAVGTAIYFAKNGFDNPFGGNEHLAGGDNTTSPDTSGDKWWLPDSIEDFIDNLDGNDPQDVQGSTELEPNGDGGGNAGSETTNLTRGELFDGSLGGRKLTPEGREALAEQLNGYTVKTGDTVWDLSEDFLKEQGVKNPTRFEIDTTKDVLLRELQATNSVDSRGWLSVGDKIRIK